MRVINKGENVIIRRNLLKSDGTALLLSTVSSLSVNLVQDGVVVEAYTYPSTYLRQGTSTSQLELEISTAVSNSFKKGKVTMKVTITFANVEFDAEGLQRDIIEEAILNVK